MGTSDDLRRTPSVRTAVTVPLRSMLGLILCPSGRGAASEVAHQTRSGLFGVTERDGWKYRDEAGGVWSGAVDDESLVPTT